jgi:hypothetical protein
MEKNRLVLKPGVNENGQAAKEEQQSYSGSEKIISDERDADYATVENFNGHQAEIDTESDQQASYNDDEDFREREQDEPVLSLSLSYLYGR